MKEKKSMRLFLVAASSFIGGVGLGLLMAPRNGRQNRQWLIQHVSEWSPRRTNNKKRHTLKRQLRKLRNRVKRGYDNRVPDLYAATDQLDLGY
ncbi:hypothetical protein [Halalkalibaculum sp. DA384]|uniref:hypothetical protein n=1 Tax=Halalkalibaculum sp. DA384 TaxID=3373606 RepID=UPI0037542A73